MAVAVPNPCPIGTDIQNQYPHRAAAPEAVIYPDVAVPEVAVPGVHATLEKEARVPDDPPP